MSSLYQFKGKFQNILRPWAKQLAARGITPNQVTITAIVLSGIEGACIAFFHMEHWPFLLLPFVLFIRMALNAIDGMMAREHNMKTQKGVILNEMGDVISDMLLYLPFIAIFYIYKQIVIICILTVIAEMSGVVAVQIGASRRYDGPMGKSDRAFAFSALGVLMGMGISRKGWFLKIILLVIILLLVVTIYNRAKNALKEVEKSA